MQPELRVFPDLEALSAAVADSLAERLLRSVERNGRFSIALAGGQTPKALYKCLAAQYTDVLPWSRTHFFWSDERYVPYDHPSSNYGMAREALLDSIDVPPGNIHAMPTHAADPAEAARAYQSVLEDFFTAGKSDFDLVLLGMGADGHTASLFPGTDSLKEQARSVVPSSAPVKPFQRLTFTFPRIQQSEAIYFLIAGEDKAETLRNVLAPHSDVTRYPIARILCSGHPGVVCWTDKAAAALAQRV
jgi:6-phosphogluconolactonase